ncbi:MAG: 4-hydroxythreonine-4-phosphate dehydrogenase PdxA [Bacteroidetes bacterium]|jgi:4-hydroxythreonine-4-phosphate dehydrogenase|nr:4-hydroxythreonine-4-phosphate dehydrogenase PdxA [Bacteroidota bacterium]
MTDRIKIAMTVGDINGIGLEVILKSMRHPQMLKMCTPVVYGSGKIVAYHKNILTEIDYPIYNCQTVDQIREDHLNVVNIWQDAINIELGKATKISGQAALDSLDAAVTDLKENKVDALVTAPISKHAMQLSGFPHVGHTEYLSQADGAAGALMLMVSREMKMGLVTAHIPIRSVTEQIHKELITKRIGQLEETLKRDFSLTRPTIAVLGLNPHAGDEGLIGNEDDELVRPAIIEAKKAGSLVMGPFSADGFFGSGQYRKFDGILAMYHDQGLIPFKALSFGDGVNYTAGLSFVRTSPDHGTAFEIAGKDEAHEGSMIQAIFRAVDIVRSRQSDA